MGKVYAFHLRIPSHIQNKPIRLHPDFPVSAEIVQAGPHQPKRYCITAYCAEAETAEASPIRINELFWDKVEDKDIDIDLEVRVLPARTSFSAEEAGARSLASLTEPQITETTQFRAKSRYEDMPVDDP